MNKVKVLIAGSTGYIGVQLVKLLCNHKYTKIKYLCGNSSVGKKISLYDKSLKKYNLPKITKLNYEYLRNIDVIFTALPNGESQIISNKLTEKNILIDLSADFRLQTKSTFEKYYKIKHKSSKNIKKSIYAIPELVKKNILNKKIIACPGCYPTSILIPLLPLLKKKLINTNNIIIDSKSGYSGAGRNVHKIHKNNNLYESLSIYGVSNHRHNSEIQQEFNKLSKKINFEFTPHLSPMFRGILTTIYIENKKGITNKKIINTLRSFYKKDIFVRIKSENSLLSTNNVINTNFIDISICKTKNKKKTIIISTIDNLIKGGAGQALQNFNRLYNFKDHEGLR
tara:strand:+ start:507 stop:1526 length:1020 start_codon:yes stop_codon:yes gene_type:complete